MAVNLQTDGFVALGEQLNDEHKPCLVCGKIPDSVHVDLFTPEPRDIPASLASRVGEKTLAITYRLCPRCFNAKPRPWKIRLLLLERMKGMVNGL